jgi:glycosyltransferase involved in cell wall biosynthesis
MEEILDNYSLRRVLSKNVHNYALTNFTWESKAKKIVEIYNWVLNKVNDKPIFGI